jgi:trigger factor
MNLSVRSSGPWQHTLDIEVPVDEVDRRLEDVARQIQRRASLPGFRRGKVPLDLVRQHFADTVEREFLEAFVPRVTSEAMDEARLSPIGTPEWKNLRFTPGQPLRFEAVVEVRPEVEVRDYRGLPARRHVNPVDDSAVEKVLEGLLEESAVYADLERPAQRGDVVLLDSTRLDANGRRLTGTRAKARRVPLGSPEVFPELENALLGAEAGQERTFELHYPAEYGVPELAGKTMRYVVQVRKIQEKKLRELDDNLAKDVFHLESLDELKSRIRLNLEGEERVRVQRELEAALVGELIQRNPFELPVRLVETTLHRVMHEVAEGRTLTEPLVQELEKRYRPQVERSLRREVLLSAIARQEKLEVGEAEVGEEIDRMAQADPRQAARVRARYQSADRRDTLRESLLERKALDWLINAADVQDEAAESPLVVPAGR